MPRWIDEITLIEPGPTIEGDATNENGFTAAPAEEIRATVYCAKKSVGYSEFYKAQQAGISADLKVDVFTEDYGGQTLAELSGRRYRVVRTYTPGGGDITELTLSDLSTRGGGSDGEV